MTYLYSVYLYKYIIYAPRDSRFDVQVTIAEISNIISNIKN